MKPSIQHLLIGGGVILTSGFLVNAMSVKKEERNIYEQAEAEVATTSPDSEVSPMSEETFSSYKVYAIDLPENLDFAGERVPIEDPDFYERLDREFLVNTYWQSN